MPTPTIGRPIQVEIELTDLCGYCQVPISIHAGFHPTAVITGSRAHAVGNPECARLLHCRLHRLCPECHTPTGVGCRHTRSLAAELARVPVLTFRGGLK